MKRIEKEVAFKLGLPEGSYEVLREAQRIADIEKEKYISFQEAVTFCDKCAFMWDMNEMKLCAKCGKNYHSFKYTQCKECYNKEIYGEDLFGGQS
jgi:predicted Zn-ribbon and HTH transcriptional regulator